MSKPSRRRRWMATMFAFYVGLGNPPVPLELVNIGSFGEHLLVASQSQNLLRSRTDRQ